MAKRTKPPAKSAAVDTVDKLAAMDSRLDTIATRAADDFTQGVGRAVGKWWRGAVTSLGLQEKGGNLRRTRANENHAGAWARALRANASPQVLPTIVKVTNDYIWQGVSLALAGNRLSGWNGQLDSGDRYLLDRLIARRHKDMVDTLLHFSNQAQTTLSNAIQSSQNVREVRFELSEYEASIQAALYRQADRLIYELAQTIIARKAGVGSVKERKKDAYLYSGPIDKRCRNFCLGKVGRVWSKGAIDRMDNGQTPNTFITRGGYNCRHLWRPVEAELALLADTNKFASADMAAQHRSVVAALRRKGIGRIKRVA